MKTLKNILIGVILLSGCNPTNHMRFDLSRLEPWQKNLFIEAGNYWNMSIKDDKNSKNAVYLGTVQKPSIAFTNNFYSEDEDNIFYDIAFDKEEMWNDCSKDRNTEGYDFFEISKHELGHVLGKKHSENPKDIMYHYIAERCKNE